MAGSCEKPGESSEPGEERGKLKNVRGGTTVDKNTEPVTLQDEFRPPKKLASTVAVKSCYYLEFESNGRLQSFP